MTDIDRSSAGDRLDQQRLDELWDFGDPAASAERFTVELESASTGSQRRAELTTQLARAEGLQGHEQRATELLNSVRQPVTERLACRLELERGRIENSAGRPAAGIPHFTAALGHATAAGDNFLAIDAVHMLAITDIGRADDWTRQGLGLVARTRDARTRRWAGSLRSNYGWTLHGRGDHLGALRQFEAAVEAYLSSGTADQVYFARWAMARALRFLERLDEALEIQLELLAMEPTRACVHEELAEIRAGQGWTEQAEAHRRRARELSAS